MDCDEIFGLDLAVGTRKRTFEGDMCPCSVYGLTQIICISLYWRLFCIHPASLVPSS